MGEPGLGDILRRHRERLGLSQEELAARLVGAAEALLEASAASNSALNQADCCATSWMP